MISLTQIRYGSRSRRQGRSRRCRPNQASSRRLAARRSSGDGVGPMRGFSVPEEVVIDCHLAGELARRGLRGEQARRLNGARPAASGARPLHVLLEDLLGGAGGVAGRLGLLVLVLVFLLGRLV